MKKIIMTLACSGFVSAAGAGVNFDRGAELNGVIESAAVSEVRLPDAKFGMLIDATRDCKKITFSAADPLISPEVSLKSVETYQECQDMGYPAGNICHNTYRYYDEKAGIVITAPRELKPDQREVFEVCLWGAFLSLKPVSPAYKYSIRRVRNVFELTPPAVVNKGNHSSQEVCRLVMDSAYNCLYQCRDGSYVSRPNYSPPASFPGGDFPLHGCALSVPMPQQPLITITK